MSEISKIAGQPVPVRSGEGAGLQPSGDKTFGQFLEDVNRLITDAGSSVENMAGGEVADIHDVMIAMEKASIGLELVVEIRNKLLESYREFMRMQV